MTLMVTQAEKPRWGWAIKAHREQLGENQRQFAARWGVSQATVSYWENDEVDPPGEVTWWLIKHPLRRDEYGNLLFPCDGKCVNPEEHHK